MPIKENFTIHILEFTVKICILNKTITIHYSPFKLHTSTLLYKVHLELIE